MNLALLSLLAVALLWLVAYRLGITAVRRSGVDDRVCALALGAVLPSAGLVLSIHCPGTVALLTHRPVVVPLAIVAVYAAYVTIVWLLVNKLPPAADEPAACAAQPSQSSPRIWRAPLLILGGMYLVFLIDAATRYPAGFDSLWYHLRTVGRWMQSGTLDLVPGLLDQTLPENAMMAVLLLAHAGLQRLFDLAHLPCALFCGLLIYALARALGVSRIASSVAAATALSIPLVVFQSVSSYVDLYAAQFWLSSLLALVWVSRIHDPRRRRVMLFIAGLAAGIALGSKTTFLLLVLWLFAAVLLAERLRPMPLPNAHRRYVRSLAIFGVACLLTSGFWFLRATVATGNPLYPLPVKIHGIELFSGIANGPYVWPYRSWLHRIEFWWAYPWFEPKHGGGYHYGVGHGLGAAYAVFVPIGLVAALLALLRRPRTPTAAWRACFTLMAFSAIPLVLTVLMEHLRYVLPLVLLGPAVAAVTIDRLVAAAPRRTWTLATCSLGVTAIVAAFYPAHALLGRIRDGVWTRTGQYQIPPLVEDLPPGTRILNLADDPDCFPLMGRRMQNVVICWQRWRLLTDGAPLSNDNLRANAIDYIFTQDPAPKWPADLAVRLVFNGVLQQPDWMSPKGYLYHVEPPIDRRKDLSDGLARRP